MKRINQIKLTAELALGMLALMAGILSIYKIFTGDLIGLQLLLSIPFFLLLMWLGWNQPIETGVGLVILGVFIIVLLSHETLSPLLLILPVGLILISGLMFLVAYFTQRRQYHDL